MSMTRAGESLVLMAIEEGVATLTLNRPGQHNALDQSMADALLEVLLDVEARGSVRCVLLRAAGRSFGVGGDLSTFADPSLLELRAGRLIGTLNAVVRLISRSDKLFVCAAQGAVAGGSLGVALCCDYWLWGDDAKLTPAYALLGSTPDCGLSWALVRALGPRRALQWLLDGTTWSAPRAMVEGLGYGVALAGSLDAAAHDLAVRLSRVSRHAVRGTKRLIEDAQGNDLDAQLEREMGEFISCTRFEDFRREVEAFAGGGRRR